jgi:hypothetical protein
LAPHHGRMVCPFADIRSFPMGDLQLALVLAIHELEAAERALSKVLLPSADTRENLAP